MAVIAVAPDDAVGCGVDQARVDAQLVALRCGRCLRGRCRRRALARVCGSAGARSRSAARRFVRSHGSDSRASKVWSRSLPACRRRRTRSPDPSSGCRTAAPPSCAGPLRGAREAAGLGAALRGGQHTSLHDARDDADAHLRNGLDDAGLLRAVAEYLAELDEALRQRVGVTAMPGHTASRMSLRDTTAPPASARWTSTAIARGVTRCTSPARDTRPSFGSMSQSPIHRSEASRVRALHPTTEGRCRFLSTRESSASRSCRPSAGSSVRSRVAPTRVVRRSRRAPD